MRILILEDAAESSKSSEIHPHKTGYSTDSADN